MSALASFKGKARRCPLVLASLVLLVALPGVLTPSRAHGAVNEGIELSDFTLVKSDRGGNESSGYLSAQDLTKLTYRWDATNAVVSAGNSFSLNLGKQFNNLQYPLSVPLEVSDNGKPTRIGTCTLGEEIIDCSFSAKVEELKAAGFTDFKGTGKALLHITGATTAEEVEMSVNGTRTVKVDLPDTGGIRAPSPAAYKPETISKMGQVINANSASMNWELNIGADYLKARLAAAGQNITMDGATRQTIVVTETLGPGMAFTADKSKMLFGVRNSAAKPHSGGAYATNAQGQDLTRTYGDFDLSVEVQGSQATFTITGPFAEQTNYRLSYPVTFTSPNAKATLGAQYRSRSTLKGTEVKAEFTRSYVETVKSQVETTPGFGGFELLSMLGGPALDVVDVANTTVPVRIDYTLPAPASAYPNWKAPGTLNADGRGGTVVLNVNIGQTATFPGTFPKGTVLTLSADTARATPAPSGYAWGTPTFCVGLTATNTLTIGDRTSIRVTLDNIAEAAPPASSAAEGTHRL